MGTYRSTHAHLIIPDTRLAPLLTAVEEHRVTSGHVWDNGDDSRHVTDTETLVDLLLERLGSTIDGCDSWEESDPVVVVVGSGSKTYTFGFIDGGCHHDHLGKLLVILAAHGVTGTLEHNEDDRDFYRHRLEAGVVHMDSRHELYEGDTVLWVGQMQHHDEGADDVVVHAHSEELAVAALAAEARTGLAALAADGVIRSGLLTDGATDTDVLAVWESVVSGSPHTVRPVTI